MAAKFVYRGRERTSEDVSRRATQAGAIYDSYLIADARVLKVREGEATIRIMPATWEDFAKWGNSWEIQIWLHYGIGPDEAAYLCLDKMKGERCPICEARRDAADADEADKLKPSFRALCWAIDRDNEKAGPQIWSMPATLFREINARCTDKKTGGILLIDAAGTDENNQAIEGYDILFSREGTDIKTKYTAVEISRESSPLHDDVETEDRWLAYIAENPLPGMLQYYDAAYIEKVLGGQTSRRRDERGDDRGGRRSERDAPSTGRRRAPRDEPVEESVDTQRGRGGSDQPLTSRSRAPAGEREETPWEGEGEQSPRRPSRGEAPPEDPAPTGRRRPTRDEQPPDADPPPEGRRRASVPADEGEQGDAPAPARQARASLDRMRSRRGS